MAYKKEIQRAYRELDTLSRQRYGIPGNVLLDKLEKGESGRRANAVSSAGARKWFQFMPGTRNAVVQKYGVDPYRSEAEARDAAVLHLTGRLGNAKGLEGYNPGGGQEYVRYILMQKVAKSGAKSPAPAARATPAAPNNFASLLPLLLGGIGGGGGGDPLESLALTLAAQRGSAAAATPSTPASPGAPGRQSGNYPLGKRGKVIGTPYSGTHAKDFNVRGGSDNWQSENAVDVRIPVGTPVYAEESGTLGNTGSLGQGGRFSGLRTNLIGKSNSYYYAHLSKLAPGIRAGARVKKGQLLGYSGEANGVPHLHFAVERGDPRNYVR